MNGDESTESDFLADQLDWLTDERISESKPFRYSGWLRHYAISLQAPTEPTRHP